jgi:hypothetical protein
MTDFLTSLVIRNQRPAGIRPRLPSMFEKARRNGTEMSKGTIDKAQSLLNPGPSIFRVEESPLEIIETTEVQQSKPPTVRHQVVHGPAAFRKLTRITIPVLPSPEEVLVTERAGAPSLNPGIASQEVGKKVQTKPQKDHDVGRPERSGSHMEGPGSNLDVRRADVEPLDKVSPMARKVMPSRWSTMEPVDKTPNISSIEPPEERTPVRSSPKGAGFRVMMAKDTENARSPGGTIGIQPSVHQKAVSSPSGTPAPEGIRPILKHPIGENKGKPVQEPFVQVTIGRIEVRAVPAQEAKGRRGKMPELDLADYLRKPDGKVTK